MTSLFVERPSMRRLQAHLDAAAGRFEITDVHIVKLRGDTKIIARGMHPDWGPVALKVVDPLVSDRVAYKCLHADELIAANPAPLFPKLYAFGLGYSVSEWILGEEVAFLDCATLVSLPVIDFVDSVRAWSASFQGATPLAPSEVLSAVHFYLGASVRRMSYRSGWQCLRACMRFINDNRRIAGLVDEMASLASELNLKQELMLTDLNPRNVMYDRDEDRLVYIDIEPLRPGNSLFDIVFLLAHMIVRRMPITLTSRLAQHAFSKTHMPESPTVEFFQRFASYLILSYMIIDGQHRDAIQESLESIDMAGRGMITV